MAGMIMAENITAGQAVEHVGFDFSTVTVKDLIYCTATWETQIVLGFLQAVLWKLVFTWFQSKTAPWLAKAPFRERMIQMYTVSLKNGFGITFPTDEDYFHGLNEVFSIILQHMFGGLLCLPAMSSTLRGWLGLSLEAAHIIGCHGALCEVGFEIQDLLTRAYQVLFTRDGRAKNPPMLLFLVCCHHCVSLLVVMPMNIFLRTLDVYYQCVFMLQAAAAFALLTQCYGWAQDIKVRGEMIKLRVATSASFAVIVVTRMLLFPVYAYRIQEYFGAKELLTIQYICVATASFFHLLNILFFFDSFGKVKKFWAMPLPHATMSPAEKAKTE